MSSILKVDSITDVNGNAIISSDGSGNLTPNTFTGLTISGNLSVDGGTIKLDGNYPTGLQNVALGDGALGSASFSGDYNTAIGYQALTANTSGVRNTAVGRQALYSNTTGIHNTAIGFFCLANNTTGEGNTATGYLSLDANTTGNNNTAYGWNSLGANTSSNNTAVGYQTLEDNTSGTQNTAVGANALSSNTTSDNNDAFGYATLSSCTGSENAGFGRKALQYVTTGLRNSGIGHFSGNSLTTGSYNTFLGDISGYLITTGSNNTILGRYNGNQGGLDIRTSSNNIVLSDGDGNPRLVIDSGGSVFIGQTSGSAQLEVTATSPENVAEWRNYNNDGRGFAFQNSSNTTVGNINWNASSTSYLTSSDYRLKENVVDMTGATERLKQLLPKRFNFIADADTTVDGFLAHEVSDIVPEAITGTKDEVDADGNPVYQGIDQSKLVPLLVATIKELEARITALEGA